MKNEIKVPSMGESISEAVVGSILVPSGQAVKADEAILELETDKVNQQLYAPQPGVLILHVQTGETVKIGQVIGAVESNGKKEEEKPAPSELVRLQPEDTTRIRYMQADFIKDLQQPLPLQEKSLPVVKLEERETRRRMPTIRKVIAKRLVEVQQSTATLTTFNEIDISQVIQLREKYKDNFIKKHGIKLGFMPFFVKATVSALQAVPDLNSYIEGDDLVHREYYDIAIAVGTDRGLIVPVIRNCDALSFAQIEQAIESFAKKAKEGKLAVEELQGGSFTITNGGVYGSLLSTPILNPPQSGILGMHKIEKRAVVVDDQIVIRPMMYVALSYDHRVVDGKEAVTFLVHIKNLLEDPSRLLLDV